MISPKRIYNFCLLHACFGSYFYAFDTLSYLFDHIWTNLLTQCTQCQFLSADVYELQVFTHIYSGPKIPTKIYKKISVTEASRVSKEVQRGATPSHAARGRDPTLGCARRAPGWRGHPLVPTFGLCLPLGSETLGGPSFRELLLCFATEAIPILGQPDEPVP